MLERYEITIKSKSAIDGKRLNWHLMFDAENFAHAEEQAKPYVPETDEIIKIEKD